MELTAQAEAQLRKEIQQAMEAQGDAALPLGVLDICKHKDIVLQFIDILVGLLPGVIGKLAGKAIKIAAETWFSRKCG